MTLNETQSSVLLPGLLVTTGSCIAAYVIYRALSSKKDPKVPKVSGFPVIGNMLDLLPETFLDRMIKRKEQYGNVFYLHMFFQKFIHISDTNLCREVLSKRPKTFVRGRVLNYMAETLHYLPYGLFHANDAHTWGRMRKMTSPAFSKQNLSNMSALLLKEGIAFAKHLKEISQDGATLDMVKESTGYTVRVISSVAFGSEAVEYFFGQQFYEDVRVTFNVLLDHAMFPFPQWVWRLTPGYRMELAAIEADRRFSQACQEVISIKRAQHATMEEEQKKELHSLIDIMIRQEESRDDEMLANVKTFYVAGSDTTSMSISWALFLLAQHPGAVAQLREEVAAAGLFPPIHLSPNNNSSATEKTAAQVSEAMSGLVFTHAVLKEAVRLYPAGPAIFLDFINPTDEPVTLSNGVVIQADTTVITNLSLCLRDAEHFPQPDAFLPQRWLSEDKAALGRMEQAFMGFGAGARMCPGMGLAMAEGVMALAAVLHHFDLQLLCSPAEVKAEFKFTLQPSQLPMRLTSRRGE